MVIGINPRRSLAGFPPKEQRMFAYTDPGKTLKPAKALTNYRLALHLEYSQSARLAGSAFTLLEAFEEVSAAKKTTGAVEWAAFPRSATATNTQIDADRFRWQDEYVEWTVTKAAGKVTRVIFTTEFLAYYEALARIGPAELTAAVKAVMPAANPKVSELFGPGFTAATASALSEEARASKFRNFAQQNPWVNGQKGILCLAHGSSTLGALFRLVDVASIPNPAVPANAICGTLGGNCVPDRNSDPNIAAAVQTLSQNDRSFSLADPAGIEISTLGGIWRLGNQEIDINDKTTNQGVWKLTRGNRRGELTVPANLVLDDNPITSGAQVAAALRVKSSVVSSLNADLPEWARVGKETSQRLKDITEGGGQ
jgi:hypothetical protein